MLKKIVLTILILLIIAIPLFYYGMKTVEAGEVAVKTRLFPITGKKGISETCYGSGMYLVIPFLEKIDIFNGRIQTLVLTARESDGDRDEKDSIYIQTSDGTYIYVDATLLFQIEPDRVNDLLASLGHNYLELKVRPEFIAVLKAKLGELKAEEFYNAEMREAKSKEARDELNNKLTANGIKAVNVFIRDYEYRSGFEEAIRKRKLADQLKLMNIARTQSSEQASEYEKILAKGEAMALVEIERGKSEAIKIKADANLYIEKKKAEGKALIEVARANGNKLIEKAMKGEGGRNIVAMEMAEVLKGLENIVIQTGGEKGVNPLDINSLLKLSEVK